MEFTEVNVLRERLLTNELLESFREHLLLEERSTATIEKYCRDTDHFARFASGEWITKEITISYKNKLKEEGYKVRSINSMLAAVNSLFAFLGWHDLKVKTIKVQQEIFCPEDKELTRAEYERLVKTAGAKHNERLSLLIQTICCTGIRVSEIPFITVEAVKQGLATVDLKGKTRSVFIVKGLRKALLRYSAENGIKTGSIFITRRGKTLSRSNIWRDMKALCMDANVNPRKVFPHNLRHLFARVFYGIEKDIAKLADILGHSSINTTRIYIISSGNEHRRCMESMRLLI